MRTLQILVCTLLAASPILASLPNLIILLADDMGWDDVSWHNPGVLTPHLQHLADTGVRLQQHYSQDVCSPSRAALLTGRYPIHTGFHNGVIEPKIPYGLDTSFITLGQELKRANYSTHLVGKWHLGFCRDEFWPTNRGFDSFFGFLNGAQTYFTHTRGGGYDFRDQDDVYWEGNGTYSSSLLADRAVTIIEQHSGQQPLFLYLPFQSVHGPLEVTQEFLDLYPGLEDPDRRTYLAMVSAMDAAVGRVTAALQDQGLWENSVVLFMSDNGGPVAGWPPGHETAYAASNSPLRGGKFSLWEGGTRTLASLTAPGLIEAGTSDTSIIHITDWFTTLLAAAGLTPSEADVDGINQWDSLRDPSLARPRQEVLYNIFSPSLLPLFPSWDLTSGLPISAIRRGDWKYIRRTLGFAGWAEAPERGNTTIADRKTAGIEDVQQQLFNLSLDPQERQNLAPLYPELVLELELRLLELEGGMSNVTYPHKTQAGDPANFGGVWSSGWC